LLLMDEPFGALDAFTRDQMNVELLGKWEEIKNTVLFVTHGIEGAVFLADKVVVLSQRPGRLHAINDRDLPRARSISVQQTPEFGGYMKQVRGMFAQMGLFTEAV